MPTEIVLSPEALMKHFFFVFLITAIFGTAAFAQNTKSKIAALPADAVNWTDSDSSRILDNALIKTRLKQLLGKKNYAAFLESFETRTPIIKNGNVLFSSGCLIHACTHLESAVAIDLKNNTVHAALYNDEVKPKFFNERNSATPQEITQWINNLLSYKN
jgi:hypothetical protein